VKPQKYSIFTLTDSKYFLFTEVFLKSLFSKLNLELIEKVYVCDQGLEPQQRKFVESFDKVEIVNPVEKIEGQTGLVWDKVWLEKVGSKTQNLLKLVNENPEPIVMIDIDSMFIKDFYDLLDFEKDIQIAHRPLQDPSYIASFVSINKKTCIKFIKDFYDLLDFEKDIQIAHRPLQDPSYIASFVSINKKTCIEFIEDWIRNISRISKIPYETKALALTLNELNHSNFQVGQLPVEQIHFYDQEQYVDTNDTRIAHFKGWTGSMSKVFGSKEDFESRTFTRGYQERLKEYIDVSGYIGE